MMDANSKSQIEWMSEVMGGPYSSPEFQEQQMEQSAKINRITLKYFNIFVVLFMPLYTFLAFFVYRKPYNYGEHLVVNSYVQGISFLSSMILFLIAILVHPAFFLMITLPLLVLYYTYIYGQLYRLSIGRSVLKVLIFMGVLAGVVVSLFMVTTLVAIVVVYIIKLLG